MRGLLPVRQAMERRFVVRVTEPIAELVGGVELLLQSEELLTGASIRLPDSALATAATRPLVGAPGHVRSASTSVRRVNGGWSSAT